MKLSHNGVEWCGTFQMALDGIATDILKDGPVKITVTYMGGVNNEEDLTGVGYLQSCDDDALTFTENENGTGDVAVIRREWVLAVEF